MAATLALRICANFGDIRYITSQRVIPYKGMMRFCFIWLCRIARELQTALEYAQWRRFQESIGRAKTACEASGLDIRDHFADVGKMVDLGSGSQREIADIKLSRYACYLIVMNGDPRKEVIALGQTYFAVKTRQKEI